MTGISRGSGPAGMISERTLTRCSSAPNRSASPHAKRTAFSEWALKSVGASTRLMSITQRAPGAVCRLALLADQASKPLAKVPGDRSRPAGAQRASVALDHGNQLGGSAGQETLVGCVNIVAIHGPFDDCEAGRTRQFNHGVASDSLEDARVDRGSVEDSPGNDEDVVACTLGNLALVIEHERFEAAGIGALNLGKNVVQVVERLDPGVDGIRVVARRARRDDLQSMLVKFLGVEADLVGDDDDLGVSRFPGVKAQASGAPRDDDADVGVQELVDGQSVNDRPGHFFPSHGDLEKDGRGRVIKPVHMLLKSEDLARVGPNSLEDPVAVQ